MSRLKRTSAALETAWQRLAGIRSITPAPDYGPTLKTSDYQAAIESFSTTLNSYNEELSSIDRALNELEADEAALTDLNRRMLSATEAHYGPDSNEYEQVGGTRTSDRKRRGSKGETPTVPPTAPPATSL